MRSCDGGVGICCYGDEFIVAIGGGHDGRVGQIHLYLLLGDLEGEGEGEGRGQVLPLLAQFMNSYSYQTILFMNFECVLRNGDCKTIFRGLVWQYLSSMHGASYGLPHS